jgi:uncharacterized membrane protein YeaQ/YmgE (transglycosylase-associated protein family)
MNIVMWVLAGGIVGWAAFNFLKFNEGRGMVISVLIGAAGGFVGGKLIAPMFLDAAAVPAAFSMPALFFAAAVAAGFLFVGNLVHDRWGV